MSTVLRRIGSGAFAALYAAGVGSMAPAAATAARKPIAMTLALPGGQRAVVDADGVAQVYSKDRHSVETRVVPLESRTEADGSLTMALPDKGHLLAYLAKQPTRPFAAGEVVVVLRDGVNAAADRESVPAATLLAARSAKGGAFAYTSDLNLNRTLSALGVDLSVRLFTHIDRATLASMRSHVRTPSGAPALDLANVYRLHLTASSVPHAVTTLLKEPGIVYAAPDWSVSPMETKAVPFQAPQALGMRPSAVRAHGRRTTASALPTNYGLQTSFQSFLNAPAVDAAAAFDEVETALHQLPGQGQIITDVSLGDLDDAGAATNPNDPCNFYASVYGPTTEIQGGQRYLDLPSMPLIAAYTASASGALSGTGEVCGVDPYLGEVDLDFAVMAPLPHDLQRAGEVGTGQTDLLGIAPGAQYRLVVPQDAASTTSDIDAAFLAAATQSPRPTVITASLGFGYDAYGFAGRYEEDDPLSEAVIASIVSAYNVVVCVSSNDGTRLFTTVAIGPSGGSVPTEVIANGAQATNLNDVGFSTVPSRDYDSGSIDVGGTTLDDIFALPPQYAHGAAREHRTVAETRWTGFRSFSSGFGSRVNVSAPSDNIVTFSHHFGGSYDAVDVGNNGGTSASTPMTAATAAIALQVAKATGHPFTSVAQVRSFLETTGTPVLPVPQADRALDVGPQVSARRVVETLLAQGGKPGTPSVPRVAVEQRRDIGSIDGTFQSDTDPADINLRGPTELGLYTVAWITIAPDWEWLPAGTRYQLSVKGKAATIARTPSARFLPEEILKAAGLPLASTSPRTVTLDYRALSGSSVVAEAEVPLTFGRASGKTDKALAPQVPAVVTGSTIPVTYSLENVTHRAGATLLVSEPGRVDPATGVVFHPAYSVPLHGKTSGTIDVPVSSLQGGGIYGIGIQYGMTASGGHYNSDYAFVRVAPSTATAARPAAPLLTSNGVSSHSLEIGNGAPFQVAYDVSNVPGVTGATLEISAAGPGAYGIYNPFNNPNGSIVDRNGVDLGSVYTQPLSGLKGTVSLTGTAAKLVPALNHVVRVIPLKGGAAAGEAGDVSTISMDGVNPTDGGYVNNGYGIDQNGTDAFLTSGQQTASGQILTSLETFDQSTNHVSGTIASGSSELFATIGWGVFGSDVGLVELGSTSSTSVQYNLLQPVTSGTLGAPWAPPFTQAFINEAAANPLTDEAAVLLYDPTAASGPYQAFTSNITANTFSPEYDMNAPVAGQTLPNYFGFAENPLTRVGVGIEEDFTSNCGPPTIVELALKTGAAAGFTGMGAGFPYGIGVDPKTNKAAVPTLCDGTLTIYDLAAKKATANVPLPGAPSGNGFYTIADSTHASFLTEQTVSADFHTDNNSLSSVLVLDESGNVQESLERFDLFNSFLTINTNALQVNPASRQGFLFGPFQQQIEPFTY